jgi:hypothetical protein
LFVGSLFGCVVGVVIEKITEIEEFHNVGEYG